LPPRSAPKPRDEQRSNSFDSKYQRRFPSPETLPKSDFPIAHSTYDSDKPKVISIQYWESFRRSIHHQEPNIHKYSMGQGCCRSRGQILNVYADDSEQPVTRRTSRNLPPSSIDAKASIPKAAKATSSSVNTYQLPTTALEHRQKPLRD